MNRRAFSERGFVNKNQMGWILIICRRGSRLSKMQAGRRLRRRMPYTCKRSSKPRRKNANPNSLNPKVAIQAAGIRPPAGQGVEQILQQAF